MALPLETLQHKASLVQQLRTLQQNHDALLGALERRIETEMLQAGGARPGLVSAGSKRPPPSAMLAGPDAKRQRLLYDREVRTKAIWEDVNRILDRMRKNSKAQFFLHPVDPVKLKIPDYFRIIAHPMDLGTVKKKLSSKAYTSPIEALADIRQIFINCRTYNPAISIVAKQGEALSEVFERAWAQFDIDNKWAMELKRREREEQMLAGDLGDAGDDDTPVRMKAMREQLGSYIAAADHMAGLAPGSHGALEPQRPMSFEEKRKLSAHLSNLPGDKLPRVVEILQETQMMETDTDDEVELDIDQLNDATLWALREYCDAVMQPAAAPPKKTPGSGQRAPPDKRGPPTKHAPGGGMQPPAARPNAGAGAGGIPGSPQHSEGNSGGAIVESSGRGVEGTRGLLGLGDGTVAQSGNNNKSSTAFIKSQRKAGDVTREVDMAAWANVGAAAAAGDDAANGDAAGDAKPAENGEGDAVWADFAQKAAEAEQKKEQEKKQAAEEEAKRQEEEARRKQEEEEQKRQLEQLEQQKEEAEAAEREADLAREQEAIRDMQAKAKLVGQADDVMNEVTRMQRGNNNAPVAAPSGGGDGGDAEGAGDLADLGLAAVDEESDGDFEEDI